MPPAPGPPRAASVIKAEVVRLAGRDPRDNPRFLITNLRQTPRWIYEQVYCRRGDIENRIKELHHGLEIGRTSCSSLLANQLRVLLTAAAYVLHAGTPAAGRAHRYARAQVTRLRDRLLKIRRARRRVVRQNSRRSPARQFGPTSDGQIAYTPITLN